MGEHSAIEWTDSTWNPATGCTKVSAGCDNCYAHVLANKRLSSVYSRRLPVINDELHRHDPFAVRLWPERLREPDKWKTPRRIFVNSMSDLFHRDIPESYIRAVFEVMLKVDRHIYQVLTKRPARARTFIKRNMDLFPTGEIPEHIWLGSSVENQEVAYRVDHLRGVKAAVRFLSCEPLLGPLELDLVDIHWVIVGGESGAGYRRMELDWVLALKEQCEASGVAFFFKQWGGRTPKAGGRMLCGRTFDAMPKCTHVLSANASSFDSADNLPTLR